MGYSTDFSGRLTVTPPLNAAEVAYLTAYAATRHQPRRSGPYTLAPDPEAPDVVGDPDVTDHGRDPELPNLWCDFRPTQDGTAIVWDGTEKTYSAEEWIRHLVDTFLRPGARLAAELAAPVPGRAYPPHLRAFTFDHTVTGTLHARGARLGDTWRIDVADNHVTATRTLT
ncbi:hypothetical protein LO772_08325 [Yinghuangia sp. ASG 101]|uniref:hypothetical protein n=1 Tax=Yinghuangia sp. ASG 101 TaxID=2896848 RepID=UPI001E5C1198|nr:hypothetical protein [Yinghuangia sp. ASG 101]UGQ13596.1 hypothetical protein LO772_08325 [Yinghuangia sp. ASG 101]